jgi:aminoglycoside 2'-N-acetyltransferase I
MGGVTEVRVVPTEEVGDELLAVLRGLLDAALDGEFGDEDWDHTVGGWHVLVLEGDDDVLAHAAVVPRTIEVGSRAFQAGYVEGVATRPGRQGEGHGSAAMAAAGELVRTHFELGVLSTGRWSFYGRLGWERWAGPSWVRRADGLERSEDDDDGLMVLRFGPSAGVDLAAPITCEERPGDDW